MVLQKIESFTLYCFEHSKWIQGVIEVLLPCLRQLLWLSIFALELNTGALQSYCLGIFCGYKMADTTLWYPFDVHLLRLIAQCLVVDEGSLLPLILFTAYIQQHTLAYLFTPHFL